MTDQTPLDNRLTQIEQRQQQQDVTVAQINEILLAIARQQQVNAQQIAANVEGIAELRAIIRDRYGNGQTPE